MLFHREIAAMTGNAIFPLLSAAMMGWLAEFHTALVRAPGSEALTLRNTGRFTRPSRRAIRTRPSGRCADI
jgi:GntR family transcriptional regulator, sialic acid-inducible nan operon repressor